MGPFAIHPIGDPGLLPDITHRAKLYLVLSISSSLRCAAAVTIDVIEYLPDIMSIVPPCTEFSLEYKVGLRGREDAM